MASYLDFEKGIQQIDEDIANAKIKGDEHAIEILSKNLEKEIAKTYKNLNEFQRLNLARHPDRPYALDYIRALLTDSYEIHGDRTYADDPSIVCYSGYIGNKKVIVIAEQKGRGTKYKIMRNFGMPHPEGYRKALRVARLAEKFEIPVIFLIDTPGAYPGVGAEERGQSEAIARNLFELSELKTRTIAIVIGAGGSGGALAIGVADRLGCKILNIHMNPGVHFTLPTEKIELYGKYQQQYLSNIKSSLELIDIWLGGTGVHISIENTGLLHRPHIQTAVNQLLKSGRFCLTWDVGHDYISSHADREFMLNHRSSIKHIHLHDAKERNDHLELYTGEVDLNEKLQIASENQASVLIEVKTKESLIHSVAKLKEKHIFK